ncbi:TetR family transcriptional regulator [Streptomyces sp. NBC_01481]|uniref:TetR family transcriptional regulator n=1 Tax=Streptomyces sp. NBC_01481 TaxID=2975869 RepID=UPI0022567476|nr:TetR family transcriptional regulator [Streptomyces sp. NBC_01481]MCX4582296.1 TetR/AcrR family transcriptional regulator [Streptomyces sp. NBC_01481]
MTDTEVKPMVKQVRAERTRQALIAAAAIEFDRQGYAGTSLSAVHRACGVTMGALTFHFPAKADLATAVCHEAEDATRHALARLTPAGTLLPVAEFTFVVARLLDEEVTVRAAARLTQEQAVPCHWHTVWRAALREVVAPTRERPGPGPEPDLLELLAVYLTAGAEAALRAGRTGKEVRTHLECLWALVFDPGPPIAAEACPTGADLFPPGAAAPSSSASSSTATKRLTP